MIILLFFIYAAVSNDVAHALPPAHAGRVTFDVKSYGAQGNGSADDTAAINRASAAAAAHGGTLRFPPGVYIFNPAVSKILIGSNMTVAGPGTIKVKANAGDYEYIMAAADLRQPLENVALDGIVVDQNAEQNTTSTISIANRGSLQFVFVSFHIRNLRVRHCTFLASGVNTVVANGEVEQVWFENNRIVFHQRPGQPDFDNSALYFAGKTAAATGNHCEGAPGAAAVTCLEMHDGDVAVRGNTMDGYLYAIHIVDVARARVTGNTGRNMGNGISIWANPGKVARNVAISDNRFQIDNRDRRLQASFGIATYYGNNVSGLWDGITITRNVISFQPETEPRHIDSPHLNYGIGTQARGPVRNVRIAGNVIVNAPVRGIKIGDAISAAPQSGIVIERNTITNAGSNSDPSVASYRAAIAGEGRLRDVTIRNNRIGPGVPAVWFEPVKGVYADVRYNGVEIRSGAH